MSIEEEGKAIASNERLREALAMNPIALEFIEMLNNNTIENAITGSASLYIHGLFGRKPRDFDLYTKLDMLVQAGEMLGREIITRNYPPVSWKEVQEIPEQPHLLAGLACDFPDGEHFDFALTELVSTNTQEFEIDGIKVNVVPPEEVLLLKLTSPRKTDVKDDLTDVRSYLELNGMDEIYFQERAQEIGIWSRVKDQIHTI